LYRDDALEEYNSFKVVNGRLVVVVAVVVGIVVVGIELVSMVVVNDGSVVVSSTLWKTSSNKLLKSER
jgi:hypothetical protein